MDERATRLSVEEFVDYCRTQAGLLAGKVDLLGEEVDGLLDELDEGVAEVNSRLRGDVGGVDVEAVEELESDLERTQAIVEAKEARMNAFQELAAGYTDLAAELQSDVDDGQVALERVVEFEVEHDAAAYFPDRQTVAAAAAQAGAVGESDAPGPETDRPE
ncbi:MAG: hypothetical protein ABEJ74_00280 [Haloferacaceae archaeon]